MSYPSWTYVWSYTTWRGSSPALKYAVKFQSLYVYVWSHNILNIPKPTRTIRSMSIVRPKNSTKGHCGRAHEELRIEWESLTLNL